MSTTQSNATDTDTAMIQPDFVRAMAIYNGEMNRRFLGAAGRLPDEARRLPRGAFWGSIHGTLNHILWGDTVWMSRFDGWDKPAVSQKDSASLIEDFAALQRARADADGRILAWSERVTAEWLAGDLVWFSGSAGHQLRRPRGLLVVHFFNHQTHHRGQIHAMLTTAGERTGDTDLMLIV
jgi:uncharacterized damage-inducible protein DinB